MVGEFANDLAVEVSTGVVEADDLDGLAALGLFGLDRVQVVSK
ncbi:hypothetical protein [Streptomyces sp. NBC_01334]|nr:hypothetical protein OG736_43315 [Streptomyces sp. NBC_01334]